MQIFRSDIMKNIFSLLVLSSVLLTSWAKDTGAGDSNWFMAQTNAADVKSVIATSDWLKLSSAENIFTRRSIFWAETLTAPGAWHKFTFHFLHREI